MLFTTKNIYFRHVFYLCVLVMYCNCLQAYDYLYIPKAVLPSRNVRIVNKQYTINNNSNKLSYSPEMIGNFADHLLELMEKLSKLKVPMLFKVCKSVHHHTVQIN
jgi:hypothetical protein